MQNTYFNIFFKLPQPHHFYYFKKFLKLVYKIKNLYYNYNVKRN